MQRRAAARVKRIYRFYLQPGIVVADRYEIHSFLGAGWEGEVYLVRELATGIERTAKFFFPQRNARDRAIKFYSRKLHKLRHCPIAIQYHTQDTLDYDGVTISFLISEFVEGELLSEFIKRQRGKRLPAFQAIHLLYALASGIECIHLMGDYHGDLHTDNIIVQRVGLGFEFKLLDFFHWGAPSAEKIRNDVFDLIRIFYDALGGRRFYACQPQEVKSICCGLKKSLIARKFRTAAELKGYLESMEWD